MRSLLLVAALVVLGCSDANGPKAIDPSVLLVNQSTDEAKIIFASDQSGTLTYDTIPVPAGATVCARWTQSFDSLYMKVIDTLPNNTGRYAALEAPWLHFADYPVYFQIDTLPPGGGNIHNHIVDTEC